MSPVLLAGPSWRGGAAALLVFLASRAHAQGEAVDRWIETYRKDHQVPGIALGILDHGKVVVARGYGLANVELEVPVTPHTLFQSASCGKQFTAAGVLLLVQDGKLSLDDPIARTLGELSPSWSGITIRHLLSHTSGLPDYDEENTGLGLQDDPTEEELLRAFTRLEPLFPAGEEWVYSNTGYVLLGMIVGRVTGKPWGEFLRERLFEPLGMEKARVISEEDIVPGRAAGYRVVEGVLKNQSWVAPVWNTTADGSLYLSVLDLAAWDAGLYLDSPLSATTKELMGSPQRLRDGTLASYGFGWFLWDEPGRRLVEHDGAWQGFRTYIGRWLDESLTVIVLANSASAEAMSIGHAVAGLVRPALAPAPWKPISLTAQALDACRGSYRIPSGVTFQVSRSGDGLAITGLGPEAMQVVPRSADTFGDPDWPDSTLVFVPGDDGRVRWVLLRRHRSSPVRAHKLQ